MNRRTLSWTISGALILAATGAVIAAAEQAAGPALIPGDQPVTEDQIRQKLISEGYSNVQIVRRGPYLEATGSKEGQTGKIIVDPQTGRIQGDNDDD